MWYGVAVCVIIFAWGLYWSFETHDARKANADKAKEAEVSGITLQKIIFDGHSYIYLVNSWNSAGNQFLHDPGCKCFNEGKYGDRED